MINPGMDAYCRKIDDIGSLEASNEERSITIIANGHNIENRYRILTVLTGLT